MQEVMWLKKVKNVLHINGILARCSSFNVKHSRIILAAKFLALFSIFYFISHGRLDPDFGWHLQFGNYIRAHGIPSHDVFTYTAQAFHWADHEWGNDLIVSYLYGLGGYNLLAILYGILWSSALVLIRVRARFIVMLVAAIATFPYTGIRPEAWSILFFVLLLRILQTKRKYVTFILPLLFLVWANLHGGFVVGFCILAYWAVYYRRPRLLLILPLCILVTLVNPYGWRLYIEISTTLFDPTLHSQIREWSPFLIPLASRLVIIMWGVGTFMFALRPRKLLLRPTVILLAASLSSSRYVPLFAAAAIPEIDTYIDKLKKLLPKQLDTSKKIILGSIVAIFILPVAWILFVSLKPMNTAPNYYPHQAVSYLKTNGCKGGNLFNDYNLGGYLIWKLPSMPVYIDGRMPSWRDQNGQKYMDRYYKLLSDPASSKAEFKKYNIRCVLLERSGSSNKLVKYLQSEQQWQTKSESPTYILLTH